MSMNDDITQYGMYMVNTTGKLKEIPVKSTDDYNHYEFEAHHFVPKSIRKSNPELYARIVHLQKLILLPKAIHQALHACSDSFSYNGLKWYDLVFSKRKWLEGYYD